MNINFYYKYKVMSDSPKSDNLNLQLGDIISIDAPTNEELNEKLFYINYIDKDKIKLVDSDNNQTILTINSEGELDDESIESINILSKPEQKGYAKQNNLLPGNWINIYFGGDLPLIITGQITNLENDMIEIKTYPNNDIIYLDFEFKGIPEDLPIEKIEIREKPDNLVDEDKEDLPPDAQFASIEDNDLVDLERESLFKPQDIILDADQIEIGEELDKVTQIIDIPESEQRYGIDKQTNDLLDELLSSIPNQDRTPSKLNRIHTIIERYKELRLEYSDFIPEKNIIKPKIFGSDFKPLVKSLEKLDKKLYWILPVSINNRKIYDTNLEDDISYVDNLTLAQVLIQYSEVYNNWKSNQVPDEQSKYSYFLNQLNKLETPFTNNNLDNFIAQIPVNENIYTIVNTLGDEKSYASRDEELIMTRFQSQVYNLGLNRLMSEMNEERKIINTVIKATENDILSLKGILTLPMPTYKFSHINLPLTSIYEQSNLNLHYLNYWQFLNKKTIVNSISVTELDKSLEYSDENFLNNIKQFILDETIPDDIDDKYKKFLEAIVPKTRVLFNLIKDHIKGDLSYIKVVQYLEPFMIYTKNIAYKQFEDIKEFLNEKILDYKKNFVVNNKKFLQIFNKLVLKEKDEKNEVDFIVKILESSDDVSEAVLSAYNISRDKKDVTSLEIFDKMIRIDSAKLFMSAISKITVDLMVSNVLDQFIEIEANLAKEQEENSCKKYVLSKKYFAKDELEDDNGKQIFFDKKYDNTFYDIINEYQEQKESQSPEAFLDFLTTKLQETIGLNKIEASRDAEAMIKKQRPVINGDYAILEEEGEKPKIFIREDNNWKEDSSISQDVFLEGNKFFCESQFKCFEKDKECISDNVVTKAIQKKNIKKIIGEFDEKYRLDLQRIKTAIDTDYNYNLKIITKEIEVETYDKLKYNRAFEILGSQVSESDLIGSPFEKLRDLILGEADFAKKQNNIINFVLKFTREAYQTEDKYWLYCKNTNVKLLPKFLSDLAQVYISKQNYRLALDLICAEQGTLSEDGDKWIDKHSGYTIKSIDLDTEEGFDESGYKLQTRSLLEEDAGNVLFINSDPTPKQTKEVANPLIKVIQNVVLSLAQQMGISIDHQMDFIIKYVLDIHKINLPSQKEYDAAILKAQKRGDKRKLPSYEEASDSSLLILIFVFYLIAIQISIPQIKTQKTFPGCIKSFSGYPMDGRIDKTGVVYIACVANKISSSVKPWNSIYKSKESSIAKKMESIIEEYVLNNNDILELFKKKKIYLSLEESKIVPDSLDIKLWTTFLPPLIPFHIKDIQPFTPAFKSELLSSLKKGSQKQLDEIDTIKSKIIRLSLLIQEDIQKIISKEKPILTNVNGDAFLENACCNTINNTLEYFTNISPSILKTNEQVEYLSNILYDINLMTYSPLFFDPRNTRVIYPVINPEFSENIIYKTFIYYCRFATNLPIDDQLRAICQEKPTDLRPEMSLEEQIKILKLNGRNFSIDNFNQLILYISKNNIIKLDFKKSYGNNFLVLREYINYLDENRSEIFPTSFLEKINKLLDDYDLTYTEDIEEIRTLKNYLAKENDNMLEIIENFITRNTKLNKSKIKQMIECIKNLNNFRETDVNLKINNMLEFSKNSLNNLIMILPNIVLNEIDYDNIMIPRHWNLSERHVMDIKIIIKQYYQNLTKLYGDEQLKDVSRTIQKSAKEIKELINKIYYQSNIKIKGKETYSVFDGKIIMLIVNYLYYLTFIEYIKISQDKSIFKTKKEKVPGQEFATEEIGELAVDESDGEEEFQDLISDEQKELAGKISEMLTEFIQIICNNKDIIDVSYEDVMEKVLRSKEKEKTQITDYLKHLTDEEREIENIFKNSKLERWNKGLQKGLTQYVQDTYDEERAKLEETAILEKKLGINDLVTNMNKDIYLLDLLVDQEAEKEILNEQYNIEHIVGDDDFGDIEAEVDY